MPFQWQQGTYGAGSSTGGVGVLLGNGDGTFQPAMSYPSGGYSAFSVAAGDVNGDGSLDLLVANECSVVDSGGLRAQRRVGALLGNGDGTFQTAVSYSPGGSFQFCKIPGRWGSGGRFTCTG